MIFKFSVKRIEIEKKISKKLITIWNFDSLKIRQTKMMFLMIMFTCFSFLNFIEVASFIALCRITARVA